MSHVFMNFHVFMHKPVLQTYTEQLTSGFEFQISQNNRYEMYPQNELPIISFITYEHLKVH